MSQAICPPRGALVEERIDRVLTQYRESPKLLHLLRTYLQALEDMALKVCDLPQYFDLDSAVGDQLTLIGKRLGWPRCHCVCDVQPVFGFDCEDAFSHYPIAGLCDASVTWVDCGGFGIGEVCLNDDELYRKFLKVRRYQMLRRFDFDSLNACLRILWGPTAMLVAAGLGRVVISAGRELSDVEVALLQLYPRVLPLALGIEVLFHFDSPRVFGFGTGWGGFCEPIEDTDTLVAYDSQAERALQTHQGDTIVANAVAYTQDAVWMCPFDVKPYRC